MAPRRQLEPEAPASSSSESDGSSSSSEDSESEQEQGNTSPPTGPRVPKKSKPQPTQPQSESESSSSDDSESVPASGSDSEETPLRGNADAKVNPPLSAKSKEKPSKKPITKPSASVSETPAKSSTALKRSSDSQTNRDAKDSKKAKKVVSDAENGVIEEETPKKTGDDSKKQLFQRLWSFDDEIATLKGVIEYVEKNGSDPVADAFHEFMKNKLQIDVTKLQLWEKVRRLKKKYMNNASKRRTFSNPHERKTFDLSKKIWGTEIDSIGLDAHKSSPIAKNNKNQRASQAEASLKPEEPLSRCRQNEAPKMEVYQNAKAPTSLWFNPSIGDSNLEDEIIKGGLELIEGSQRLEFEEKWKDQRVEEVELFLKRIELIRSQTILALEVLKSHRN